ncbi:MAG TPA: Lpg1974 family pore-forming outer membrane protein [Gammaproteobacteria bacterium]|nr:Lpg1974 family pore-forming outer membrane protein [Gammaproteobacteria bacterium]
MKKGFFIFLIAFASQAYGHASNDASTFFFVDALFWQLTDSSSENWGQIIPPSTDVNRTIDVLKLTFDWNPGARIGVGRDNVFTDWDLALFYTWFQTRGNKQASASSGAISSAYLGNFFANNTDGSSISSSPTYRNASMRWKFWFNTLDLELGRKLKINRLLQLRPFIGVKGGIIDQHMHTTWQNPTNAVNFSTATENLKNNFWGVGPVIGIDTTWTMCKTSKNFFNVFGNFSGAALWGHWNFSDLYQNNTPLSVAVKVDTVNGVSTMARGLLGIEWMRKTTSYKASLRLAYEAQVWFDQIQYYSYNMGRLENLLAVQGLVLGFCFYF